MPKYPRLLHPVVIELEQISTADTIYDDDAREPVQQAASKTVVEVPGQVKYGSEKELSYEMGGRRENERGYILFLTRDLEARSVILQPNDRITKIGNVTQMAFITRLEPTMHYPEWGNCGVKAHFADRFPSKQRRAS